MNARDMIEAYAEHADFDYCQLSPMEMTDEVVFRIESDGRLPGTDKGTTFRVKVIEE